MEKKKELEEKRNRQTGRALRQGFQIRMVSLLSSLFTHL